MIDNEFDTFTDVMDSETVNQDFDEIDLYGEKLIEEDNDTDIQFE